MSTPSMRIVPEVGRRSLRSSANIVDLPVPFSPATTTSDPAATVSEKRVRDRRPSG